ncbi:MAG: DivIVA domain-containing protein [Acidimicrobiales bacterium]
MAADGRAEFDPKEIASAAFPTAFRGYDQEAVRQYLTRLAAAVGRAQQLGILGSVDYDENSAHIRAAEAEREAAELRARVDELEELVEAGLDEEAVDVTSEVPAVDDFTDEDAGDATIDGDALDDGATEADDLNDGDRSAGNGGHQVSSVAAPAIDEAELIEHLGQETANILEVARSAAADITKRADDEAALIKNEAALNAREARDVAEEALTASRVEAGRIVASASDEAAKIQERLEAEAQRAYDDARTEADRIVTETAAKVEQDLAAARRRAAQIVADAEGLREEVLADLVRRRRVHRSQLSRLSEARDRLARSLAAARSDLDEVATTIEVANGESSIDLTDPEPAVEAFDEEAVATLLVRIDNARSEMGSPADVVANGDHDAPAAFGNGIVTDDDTVQLKAPAVRPSDGVGDDLVTVDAAEGSSGSGIVVLDDVGNGESGTSNSESVDDLIADFADFAAVDGETTENAATEIIEVDPIEANDDITEIDVTEIVLTEHDVADDGTDDTDAGPESDPVATYQAQAAQAIDDLNGPIDGDRLLDQLGFTDERVLGTDDGVMGRLEARGDLPRNTPYAGRPPALFRHRDVAMTKAIPGFRRRLKRAVNDDQSDVLDRLRSGGKEVSVAELPPLEEQLTGYIAALTPALRDMVVAGVQVLGIDEAPLPAVDNLCLQLAKHIVDNVRLPAVDIVEDSTGADREAILDPIRAVYRDFRNSLLPDLIDDALHEAFALGVFHAIEADREVVWVADPRLDPDPICEDNSASPPLPKGTEFPSGHARPLSMPGCRCLAVPAS